MKNYRSLKKIRIAVSLIFFLLTVIIFLDFTGSLVPGFYNTVTYLQFIPSVLKFISQPGIITAGFLFVFLLTLILGRIYCSAVCPLGTFQDIISKIIRKIKKKKYYSYVKESSALRYSILIISVIASAAGFILFLNLLDPFSSFGKILVLLFRPLLININNFAAAGFESLGFYFLYPIEISKINFTAAIYPFILLLFIIVLVNKNGRLFCNLICPVGTLLGLAARYSIINISIN